MFISLLSDVNNINNNNIYEKKALYLCLLLSDVNIIRLPFPFIIRLPKYPSPLRKCLGIIMRMMHEL